MCAPLADSMKTGSSSAVARIAAPRPDGSEMAAAAGNAAAARTSARPVIRFMAFLPGTSVLPRQGRPTHGSAPGARVPGVKSTPMRIYVNDVAVRDGFQIEKSFVPTATKIELIDQLSRTGLHKIEVTSFVSPKAVPALADAQEVL